MQLMIDEGVIATAGEDSHLSNRSIGYNKKKEARRNKMRSPSERCVRHVRYGLFNATKKCVVDRTLLTQGHSL